MAPGAAAPPSGGVPRWFCIYYTFISCSVFASVAIWFTFLRVPYSSHVSFDPLQSLPALPRVTVIDWYKEHNATRTLKEAGSSAAGAASSSEPVAALLEFLLRFQHAGYFGAASVGGYEDHYVESLTDGWIAGVFESVRLDQARLDDLEKERQGVGSIPGGSRKLKAKEAKLVSPIVQLLDDGDDEIAASASASAQAPSAPSANASSWSQLESDHRNWVYTGLAHCHSTPCRLAKMQLVTLWQQRLALFPQHQLKPQWELVTHMFHPDSHTDKLIDASVRQCNRKRSAAIAIVESGSEHWISPVCLLFVCFTTNVSVPPARPLWPPCGTVSSAVATRRTLVASWS